MIIKKAKRQFKKDYLGFMMLGGMSGGGMGMYVAPGKYQKRKQEVLDILRETKTELAAALPFAMEPVVYNFEINNKGSYSYLKEGHDALMPSRYYDLHMAELARQAPESIAYQRRAEIDIYTTSLGGGQASVKKKETVHTLLKSMVSNLFQVSDTAMEANRLEQNKLTEEIKATNGFDEIQHEQLRKDLQKGRIGLSRNRLAADTTIEDVSDTDVVHLSKTTGGKNAIVASDKRKGAAALRAGKVVVLSLAGGVGSRWTKGAGVIKALNPFAEIGGQHRSFLEIHLGKTKRTGELYGARPPHLIATSYLTYAPILETLKQTKNYGYKGTVYVSRGSRLGNVLYRW